MWRSKFTKYTSYKEGDKIPFEKIVKDCQKIDTSKNRTPASNKFCTFESFVDYLVDEILSNNNLLQGHVKVF